MNDHPDLFASFATSVLPDGLDEEVARCLQALGRQTALADQAQVEGVPGDDTLVFLARGAAKLVAHASHEREQVVAFHFAGDLLTLPSRGAHSYSLEALGRCELLSFGYAEFLRCAGAEVQVLRQLLERSGISLRRSREKALTLGRKSAVERIASFLLSMAERIGTPTDCGTALVLPMSRRDIADSLGLTIETVSRQFTLLREQGVIATQGRSGVLLRSLDALELRSGQVGHAA